MHAASRRLTALTLDNLDDLSRPCRSCVSWELDPVAAQRAQDSGDVALEKEAWLSAVLLEWGSCGFVAYTGSQPIGHVLYAPPSMVPRAASFPTSPVSPDAILLVRPHDRWPRFRLDLRSTVNWREDVEVAVERVLGSVVREPALRPV